MARALAAREVAGPRSLMRLLGLFEALAKSKEGLSLAELNGELRSPKSSLLNLLRGLIESQQGSGTFVARTRRSSSDVATIAANAAQRAREMGVDPRDVRRASVLSMYSFNPDGASPWRSSSFPAIW